MTQPAYKIIWVDSDSNETIGQGTELNCTFHTVCDRKFLIVKAIALNNEAEKLNISLSVPENGYLNVDCGSEITLTVQVQTGEKNLLSPEDLYRMIEGKKALAIPEDAYVTPSFTWLSFFQNVSKVPPHQEILENILKTATLLESYRNALFANNSVSIEQGWWDGKGAGKLEDLSPEFFHRAGKAVDINLHNVVNGFNTDMIDALAKAHPGGMMQKKSGIHLDLGKRACRYDERGKLMETIPADQLVKLKPDLLAEKVLAATILRIDTNEVKGMTKVEKVDTYAYTFLKLINHDVDPANPANCDSYLGDAYLREQDIPAEYKYRKIFPGQYTSSWLLRFPVSLELTGDFKISEIFSCRPEKLVAQNVVAISRLHEIHPRRMGRPIPILISGKRPRHEG
ncbi:hypothetical protein JT05_14260 [Desulfosporosinus sp. Tol-M]|nr:hypothetical protein JT05_14260 [Desulfosporosinus sp. Tol-M]